MSALDNLILKKQGEQIAERKQHYTGPIVYRGQQISWRNSIKRVVKTLRRSLMRSQFASLNIVGIPGSGKTTCASNIITDLIEDEEEESKNVWHVHWKGPDDLRNLGDLLENLEKFQNHVVVFDDVSKALEMLSGTEQAEIFEQLTTTRHVTGGRLLIVSLYHYTFANLKSVKSQGVVVIYTSCTLTEYQNIQQILPTKKAQNSLRRFAKVYENAFMKGEFALKIHEYGDPVNFIDGHPFRPCFVVNLFRAHLALFMKLDVGFHPPAVTKEKISSAQLVSKLHHSYEKYGKLALRVICMQKGAIQAINPNFVRAYKFTVDLSKSYHIDWNEVANQLKDPDAKRVYRKRKEERHLRDSIVQESRAEANHVIPPREPEIPRMIPEGEELPKIKDSQITDDDDL